MSHADRTFHPFPRLPTELRQDIWRACLPERVCEMDMPLPRFIYGLHKSDSISCTLVDTTLTNEYSPLITKVCWESRSVAFKAGEEARRRGRDDNPDNYNTWSSDTSLGRINDWLDRVPSMVHMYWTWAHTADYQYCPPDPGPIRFLASSAAITSAGRASIMVERLAVDFHWVTPQHTPDLYDSDEEYEEPPVPHTASAERQSVMSLFQHAGMSPYLVVLQVVVVHTDLKSGAATGLFGPLGDAPVQIVHMVEEARIDQYFKLAEEAEHQSPVSFAQDLKRRPFQQGKQRLRDSIVRYYRSEEFAELMHPAIMFRLCTLMCNHPEKLQDRAWKAKT